MRPILLALAALCAACDPGDDKGPAAPGSDTDTPSAGDDGDSDGVPTSTDCDDADPAIGAPVSGFADGDGDGFGGAEDTGCPGEEGFSDVGGDCADGNAAIYPGVPEVCDGVDQDCADGIDDGLATSDWYTDSDDDGYGDPATLQVTCLDLSPTRSDDGTDCDDTDAALNRDDADLDGVDTCSGDCDDTDTDVHPAAVESCNGVDDDCAGGVDDGLDFASWYLDADGDTYGDPASGVSACADLSATHVLDDTDCDDTDAALDHDDADGDGRDTCAGDCADANPAIYPGQVEICDNTDQDCDGLRDEGLPLLSWFDDVDGDGYGDPATLQSTCFDLGGALVSVGGDCDDRDAALNLDDADADGEDTCAGDCDDLDPAVSSSEPEICDDLDQDCDGAADEGVPVFPWYDDADGDGWGDPTTLQVTCEVLGVGYASVPGDCDDADAAVNPVDLDGDGRSPCQGDCDDTLATVHPGVVEVCNGIDDDCDGVVDDNADADGDGYASAALCAFGTDCNDAAPLVNPGESELCGNALDEDCDGLLDVVYASVAALAVFGDTSGTVPATDWTYANLFRADAPGTLTSFRAYVDPSNTVNVNFTVYEATDPAGPYTNVGSNPVSITITEGWWDSGVLDVPLIPGRYYAVATGFQGILQDVFYAPAPVLDPQLGLTPLGYTEAAGFGLPTLSGGALDGRLLYQELTVTDTALEDLDYDEDGESPHCGDCNDFEAEAYSTGVEVCDGIDNDCDGVAPDEDDADADGQMVCAGDCDDTDPGLAAGAPERCDGADNDCDGVANHDEVDLDDDGFMDCEECDDASAASYPGAAEICDDVDNDCDGSIDAAILAQVAPQFGELGTYYSNTETYTALNVYQALRPVVLESIESYLLVSATVPADFVVYESNTLLGTYDEVARVSTTLVSDLSHLWYDSGPLGLQLETGKYYRIGLNYSETIAHVHVDTAPVLVEQDGLVSLGNHWAYGNDLAHVAGVAPFADLFTQILNLSTTELGQDVDGDAWSILCGDCDDLNPATNPDALESCDFADNDCNGVLPADEVDADGDGAMVCLGDCDDADPTRRPAFPEVCNAIDDDCSGAPDALEVDADADGLLACEECDDSVVGMGEIPLYPDGDDDGHGDLAALDTGDTGLAGATLGCLGTPGTSPVADDCDDSAAYAYPGAVESCNLADDNCDGVVDEGFAAWCAAAVYDDFDAGVPDAAMWGPIVGDGFVSGTYSASPGFSLSLGGGVASIEMVPLDLTGCPQLAMELAVKRGPESPDATDYVRLERDAGGFWTAVWSLYGLGGTDVSFLPYSAVFTDPAVLAAGTRLRFASDGSSSTADDFFLDDVSISCDADLDGLGWYSEAQYGTDASAADTDGDGATDGDELLIRGTDPLDPASN